MRGFIVIWLNGWYFWADVFWNFECINFEEIRKPANFKNTTAI